MKNPGAILLVSCYELGHQPFHLAGLATRLIEAGYQPECVDTSVEDLSDEQLQNARILAISVPMHTALRLGERLARRAREVHPELTICFYGLYAYLNATHLLQDCIDFTIGGEFETPLIQLVEALAMNQATSIIAGVQSREHESLPLLTRSPFPLPNRTLLPTLDHYARLDGPEGLVTAGYTETTRGCKHTCTHCPITPVYGGHFLAIPRKTVVDDIRQQVAQGARHITFGDPDFWNGPTHALRILNEMHSEFPDLTFDATIKIEHLIKNQMLLPRMREYGCLFIVSAVESLNPLVLQRLKKEHTVLEVKQAFQVLEEAGIALRPSLLPFTPWESLDSYIDLLNFFEDNQLIEHLDPVHLSIRLLIPPGSAILQIPEEQAWLGELDAQSYTYLWQHPDPRMDQLQMRVAELVEQAHLAERSPLETFFQIKASAMAVEGQAYNPEEAAQAYGKAKVLPHLTESWFC